MEDAGCATVMRRVLDRSNRGLRTGRDRGDRRAVRRAGGVDAGLGVPSDAAERRKSAPTPCWSKRDPRRCRPVAMARAFALATMAVASDTGRAGHRPARASGGGGAVETAAAGGRGRVLAADGFLDPLPTALLCPRRNQRPRNPPHRGTRGTRSSRRGGPRWGSGRGRERARGEFAACARRHRPPALARRHARHGPRTSKGPCGSGRRDAADAASWRFAACWSPAARGATGGPRAGRRNQTLRDSPGGTSCSRAVRVRTPACRRDAPKAASRGPARRPRNARRQGRARGTAAHRARVRHCC